MSVVVWLNGAFGAGKTTLAARLVEAWPEVLVFDAELPGYMLRQLVPSPPDDFQDLRAWRRSVVDTAVTLAEEYRRPLLVPMTVVNPAYPDEIFGGLGSAGLTVAHFFLDVRPETLRRRIEEQVMWHGDAARDQEIRQWRLAQVDRCAAAVGSLPTDTVILDGELPTAALAERVLASVGVRGQRGQSPAHG